MLNWVRRRLGLMDGTAWSAFFGGSSYANKAVTLESSLTLSAAMGCVRLISETGATLPLAPYVRDKDGGKSQASDHWTYGLLHESPNSRQTAVEFLEGEFAKVCLVGNAVSFKEQRSNGSVISLEPFHPNDVSSYLDSNGMQRFRLADRGRFEDVPADKVLHIKGFGMDPFAGLSPIAYARHSLGGAMAADETAGRYLGNGLNVSGFIETGRVLDDKTGQREQWEKTVREFQGSGNAGKLMTLEGGFSFKPLSMPAKDAQLLESRAFNVEEVCRWFRTPPILIGHHAEGQTMFGSGVEQIMIGWLTLGLRAFLIRFEQAMRKRLLLPAERGKYFLEFNVEGLLRADSAARAALYASMAQNGIYTRNEIRAKDNLQKLPGGDDLTVQSNLVPLDQLGKQGDSANQLRNAMRNFLMNDEQGDAA